VLFLLVIMWFHWRQDATIISTLYDLASITYGPLLGLFAFGISTKRMLREPLVPLVCVAAAVATFWIRAHSKDLLFGYQMGFETLILNGLLTFLGLASISRPSSPAEASGYNLAQ
jgi:hypothetical protein